MKRRRKIHFIEVTTVETQTDACKFFLDAFVKITKLKQNESPPSKPAENHHPTLRPFKTPKSTLPADYDHFARDTNYKELANSTAGNVSLEELDRILATLVKPGPKSYKMKMIRRTLKNKANGEEREAPTIQTGSGTSEGAPMVGLEKDADCRADGEAQQPGSTVRTSDKDSSRVRFEEKEENCGRSECLIKIHSKTVHVNNYFNEARSCKRISLNK